jgi:sulfhydrogenase subunit gamma (sulfur reductase)
MTDSVNFGESPFVPRLAEIIHAETFTAHEKLYRFQFRDGGRLNHLPGQFVQVSMLGIGEAPISISSSPTRGDWFELGFRSVGSVTNAFRALQTGDIVGIRGPFGNGYPVPKLLGKDLLFVAGGIGVFPLRSMFQYAVDKRSDFGKMTILYGFREPSDELFRDIIQEWRNNPSINIPDINLLQTVDRAKSDEGWEGNVGVITTLFPKVEIDPAKTMALICGPPVMYRYVIKECLKKGMQRDQILMSMERHMKCGIGLCGHCQINKLYICQDGPVFSCQELTRLTESEV